MVWKSHLLGVPRTCAIPLTDFLLTEEKWWESIFLLFSFILPPFNRETLLSCSWETASPAWPVYPGDFTPITLSPGRTQSQEQAHWTIPQPWGPGSHSVSPLENIYILLRISRPEMLSLSKRRCSHISQVTLSLWQAMWPVTHRKEFCISAHRTGQQSELSNPIK